MWLQRPGSTEGVCRAKRAFLLCLAFPCLPLKYHMSLCQDLTIRLAMPASLPAWNAMRRLLCTLPVEFCKAPVLGCGPHPALRPFMKKPQQSKSGAEQLSEALIHFRRGQMQSMCVCVCVCVWKKEIGESRLAEAARPGHMPQTSWAARCLMIENSRRDNFAKYREATAIFHLSSSKQHVLVDG